MAFGDFATLVDDFSGADESPITTNWTSKILTSNGNINKVSNQVRAAGSGVASAWYDISNPGNDCEVYSTVATNPAAGNVVRVYARLSDVGTATADGYFVQVTIVLGTNNDTCEIFRLDNGSATSLASSSTFDWVGGNKLGIECIGSAISFYRHDGSSWSQVLTTTDATYTSGAAGLGISNTQARMDDFFMGTVGTANRHQSLMRMGVG